MRFNPDSFFLVIMKSDVHIRFPWLLCSNGGLHPGVYRGL